jgi:hypothetical protein
MKAIKLSGLALAIMLLANNLQAQDNKQTLTVPLSEPGKPFKLNVDLVNGSISVIGYDGKDVIIEAGQGEGRRKHVPDTRDGMKRIVGGQDMDIVAKEKNNTITVSSEMAKRANLVIKVPQTNADFKLQTVNEGDITASNINGDLEVTNTNGSINLSNIAGSVVANTTNGKVIVTFKSTDPKAAMAFTTLNGNVDVTFPASVKANIKARSDREQVYSDFDVSTDKSEPKANKTAKDGMYRITIEDWIYAKVNGGGPEMLFKTMNGNIYIRKAK